MDRIKALEDNPLPVGCEKFTGQEKYRLRHGPYWIVYSIKDDELTVWVVKVGHRKDIYRWSEPVATDFATRLIFRCPSHKLVKYALELKQNEANRPTN